jgi:plastocyanin domain-containing protein
MRNTYTKLMVVGFAVLLMATAASAQSKKPKTQSVRIEITEMGYSPASTRLRRGVPARLTFVRLTDRTCGTEIVFPDYGINKPLPLGQAVVVNITPKKSGEIGFTCGMDMMRGRLIIR